MGDFAPFAFRVPVLLVLGLLASAPARAVPSLPTGFTDQLVVGGLNQPVGMAFLPDGRLLVIERPSGWIRLVVNGAISTNDPVGTVEDLESAFWERGLLGIAVDPGWPARPYVYVLHSVDDSTTRLSRFLASGDLTAPSSGNLTLAERYDVLRELPDHAPQHNGGTLRFGTDGMLYVSLGEDGVPCAAQDTVSLRGILLRLDVSDLPAGSGGPPLRAELAAAGNPFETHPVPEARLVWALGLRNPFRFHVDPADGSIFVSDVGDAVAEEVSHVTGPGQNFGWPRYEGFEDYANCPLPPPASPVSPIYAYDRRSFGAATIVGAGVYRGGSCASCRFPDEYLGDYFFADFYEGFLRRLERNGNIWTLAPAVPGQPSASDWARDLHYVADFQFAADGALWYCRFFDGVSGHSGEIHRIIATSPAAGVTSGPVASGVIFAPPRPLPATDRVTLSFHLPRASRVTLDLFDAAGRRIARLLASESRNAGTHEIVWEGSRGLGRPAAAGLYVARLEVDGSILARRILLLP